MTDNRNKNLNGLVIEDAEYFRGRKLNDYSCYSSSARVLVYLRDIENELIHKISVSDAVFGCVAWLTNYKIIDSLSNKDHVSIVVQKEDFLKPDICSKTDYKSTLFNKYKNIKSNVLRHDLPEPACELSMCRDPIVSSIRCVGNYNSEKHPSFPRMHNKFLVFCRIRHKEYDGECIGYIYKPYAVWTGSFNFSMCATKSFENAVLIEDDSIATAYFKEYCQILALSEPLNWESDWMYPEWRIGT